MGSGTDLREVRPTPGGAGRAFDGWSNRPPGRGFGERRRRGGLAPWVPADEPVGQLAGRSVVLVHGTADRVTDPRLTARYADRARPVARSVVHHEIPGAGHAMLQSVRQWDDLTAAAVLDILAAHGVRS